MTHEELPETLTLCGAECTAQRGTEVTFWRYAPDDADLSVEVKKLGSFPRFLWQTRLIMDFGSGNADTPEQAATDATAYLLNTRSKMRAALGL